MSFTQIKSLLWYALLAGFVTISLMGWSYAGQALFYFAVIQA